MNRRKFIGLALGAGGMAVMAAQMRPRKLQRAERKSRALGAEISLVAFHQDRATGERALDAAFDVLESIERALSLYRPESEICQLNREGFLDQPGQDLLTVIGAALWWSRATDGAFDPTVQPLWALYANQKQPSEAALDAARSLVNWRQVEVNDQRIRLQTGQAVTLNGIAQGFAADRIGQVLRAHGIRHALANTGEFGALGARPEGDAWRIGIQHPRTPDAYIALAALKDRFLATSGDYATPFSEDLSSHHIFDPATGRSPAELSSVTVLAPTGLEADALSTAIFVLGPRRGLELAASRSGVDALLVLKQGGILSTPNFPQVG